VCGGSGDAVTLIDPATIVCCGSSTMLLLVVPGQIICLCKHSQQCPALTIVAVSGIQSCSNIQAHRLRVAKLTDCILNAPRLLLSALSSLPPPAPPPGPRSCCPMCATRTASTAPPSPSAPTASTPPPSRWARAPGLPDASAIEIPKLCMIQSRAMAAWRGVNNKQLSAGCSASCCQGMHGMPLCVQQHTVAL
jgi:hypothetical protein